MEATARRLPDPPSEVPARRLTPRVAAVHTAALRVRRQEVLCKTCDLSAGGLGLVVSALDARAGDAIEVDVLFQGVLKRFRGSVAFVLPRPSSVRLGVRFRS